MSDTVKLIIEIPKELYENKKGYLTNMDAHMICDAVQSGTPLDSAKALSVPEREKGEWVYSERFSKVFPMYRCSKCSGLSASCYVKFCPNCGADMRGE